MSHDAVWQVSALIVVSSNVLHHFQDNTTYTSDLEKCLASLTRHLHNIRAKYIFWFLHKRILLMCDIFEVW